MRLTADGWRVLLAGVALLGVGTALGWTVVQLVGGAALGAVLSGAAVARRRTRLAVERRIHPARVSRGEPALASLRVTNDGTRRAAAFTASEPAGPETVSVEIPSLAAGHSATRNYPLPTGRRARLTVGPLTLRREDALGLVGSTTRTGDEGVLWVHPRSHSMTAVGTGRSRRYDGPDVDDCLRGSLSFHALREYAVGDELRHVHWKSTAKTGQLMVREYLDPQQPEVTVLLDVRPAACDPNAFEEALEVAASLVRASVALSRPTRLLTTAGLDVRGTDAAAMDLMDRLCEVQQAEGDPPSLRHLLGGEGLGGWLVVLTGKAAVPLLAELAALRRRYGLTAVIDVQPTGEALGAPGVMVVAAPSAPEAVSRWNAMLG